MCYTGFEFALHKGRKSEVRCITEPGIIIIILILIVETYIDINDTSNQSLGLCAHGARKAIPAYGTNLVLLLVTSLF